MKEVLYLAWRYLAFHRVKTAILVGAITLIVFLPVGLQVLVSRIVKNAKPLPVMIVGILFGAIGLSWEEITRQPAVDSATAKEAG